MNIINDFSALKLISSSYDYKNNIMAENVKIIIYRGYLCIKMK